MSFICRTSAYPLLSVVNHFTRLFVNSSGLFPRSDDKTSGCVLVFECYDSSKVGRRVSFGGVVDRRGVSGKEKGRFF